MSEPGCVTMSARWAPLLLALCLMTVVPFANARRPSSQETELDPIELQRARAAGLVEKGWKRYYTKRFDLSALPQYVPSPPMRGTIRQWGSNYLADSPLQGYLEAAFRKYHPEVTFENRLQSTFIGMAGLYTGLADLAAMGREATWDELQAYQRVFGVQPLEIAMASGSYDVAGWTFALAVFVHESNPLTQLTVEQLDGIFGAQRDGGWDRNAWDPARARGPEKNIRRWGELGLKGEWADKPINVYAYNVNYHFPRAFAKRVLQGGYKWNERIKEFSNKARSPSESGSSGKDFAGLRSAGEQLIEAVKRDPYSITYTGMLYRKPGVRPLALSKDDKGPFVMPSLESVQDRSYPLAREVFYYTNRDENGAVDPLVREYLRFVLSREGQELIQRDGKYLPLTAELAREQLRKLGAQEEPVSASR